jgi:hypothetical protein
VKLERKAVETTISFETLLILHSLELGRSCMANTMSSCVRDGSYGQGAGERKE